MNHRADSVCPLKTPLNRCDFCNKKEKVSCFETFSGHIVSYK